jgi:hypothetical protein
MGIPFQTIQWDNIPKEEHIGEKGSSFWQTLQYKGFPKSDSFLIL